MFKFALYKYIYYCEGYINLNCLLIISYVYIEFLYLEINRVTKNVNKRV